MYRKYIKICGDVCLASTGFMILSPLFLLLVLLLAFANDGNVFFVQARPGKNGRIFKIIKFKTMNDRRDANGKLLPDAERFTKVGRVIRKLSLDEIPQLLNVIKGDMSLIGPRPLLAEYLPLYSPEQARRHEVRPGITGWAQINGRNLLLLSKKFEYDVWYVDNVSFTLDCRIFFRTILNTLQRKGIGEGAGSMEDVDDLGFSQRMSL